MATNDYELKKFKILTSQIRSENASVNLRRRRRLDSFRLPLSVGSMSCPYVLATLTGKRFVWDAAAH